MKLSTTGIVATCQQTRFHLNEDKRSSEVAIQKLHLSIVPLFASNGDTGHAAKATKIRNKSTKAIDILVDTDLKLKAGVHYGLVGRNGTGKSTLLRAMAAKLIPGLSYATKIALLQQNASELQHWVDDTSDTPAYGPSVQHNPLDFVLQSNSKKIEIKAKLKLLRYGEEGLDDWSQIKAYRTLRFKDLQEQLAEANKNASLRSGARGLEARKDLFALEKTVAEYGMKIDSQDPPLSSFECQSEISHAAQIIGELQLQLDELRSTDIESEARIILKALGFTDYELQTPVADLSGGWQMRCVLASVLLQDADVMILDEPTNFLDVLGIVWLQKYLINLRSTSTRTVITVSHDRDFMDNVCEEIVLIKDQSLIYFDGNLTEYEEDCKSRRKYLTTMKDAQDRQKAHMAKTISQNIKAGKKSGDDKKLRQAVSRQKTLDERSGMQVNAKGGRFKLNRDFSGYHYSNRQEIEIPPEERANTLSLPEASDLRFPGPLVSLQNVSFSYKSRQKPILRDVNLTIHMGSRVGVVGLNGSGKTTLIRLITNQVQPTSGTSVHHPRLKTGYYSQLMVEDLRTEGRRHPDLTALAKMTSMSGDAMDEGGIRGLLGSFGLPGRLASDVPMSKLSGGQLVRLALACVVWDHPHLLVLDEITTHLDLYTVDALSRALLYFNGAIFLVTHDRFLMKSVIGAGPTLGAGDDKGSCDEEEDEEEDARRQRTLYVLRKAKLATLERGVIQFEESLEKRLEKLFIC